MRLDDSQEVLKWLVEHKPGAERALIMETPPNYTIVIEESVRHLSIPASRKRYLKQYTYSPVLGALQELRLPYSLEVGADVLQRSVSPSGKWELIFRTSTNDSRTTECLELWGEGRPLQTKSLATHCKGIYRDTILANVAWSPDETLCCFIAEAKDPEARPLWACENASQRETALGKYKYESDLGEAYPGKRHPILLVYSRTANSLHEVVIPEHLNVYPSYPLFDEKSRLIFVGINKTPYPRGIAGFIKPSGLYHLLLPLETAPIVHKLSGDAWVCSSPHFSPDSKQLVYFCVPTPVLTHSSGYELRSIAWPYADATKINSQVIVPVISEPAKGVFPGIYGSQGEFHSYRCGFLQDSVHLVFNSFAYGTLGVNVVNTITKELTILQELPQDNNVILAIKDNLVLVRSVSVSSLPHYNLLILSTEGNKLLPVRHFSFGPRLANSPLSERLIGRLNTVKKQTVTYGKAEGYLYFSTQRTGTKQPLLVLLHGGPHSTFAEIYFNHVGFFLLHGYAVVLVNYRGSIGYGNDMLQSLMQHIGEYEVEDVTHITTQSIAENKEFLDEKNIFVAGYSYGGYITTWILAKYPRWARAAVVKNPACSVVDLLHTVDIPGWAYAVTLQAEMKCVPSLADMKRFYETTPLYAAEKIVDPLMIQLGGRDARVPNISGMQLHTILQKQKTPTELYLYPEDNHSLSSPDADELGALNTLRWFEGYKQH